LDRSESQYLQYLQKTIAGMRNIKKYIYLKGSLKKRRKWMKQYRIRWVQTMYVFVYIQYVISHKHVSYVISMCAFVRNSVLAGRLLPDSSSWNRLVLGWWGSFMILQALVRHLLEYRSCRVGIVVQLNKLPSAETSCPDRSCCRTRQWCFLSGFSPPHQRRRSEGSSVRLETSSAAWGGRGAASPSSPEY